MPLGTERRANKKGTAYALRRRARGCRKTGKECPNASEENLGPAERAGDSTEPITAFFSKVREEHSRALRRLCEGTSEKI